MWCAATVEVSSRSITIAVLNLVMLSANYDKRWFTFLWLHLAEYMGHDTSRHLCNGYSCHKSPVGYTQCII